MKQEDAKQIWGRVHSEWLRLPKSERGEGSKKKIAQVIWSKEFSSIPFPEWWKDMTGQSNIPTNRNDASSVAKGINTRYKELALKYDVLPSDSMLSEMWDCSMNTLTSIRSKLNANGFVIERMNNGQYTVKERPHPLPVVAEIAPLPIIQPALISTNGQCDSHLIDVIRQEFAHQNIRINELSQIMADCAQSLRSIAEAWRQ